jgi:hypothetical protein
LLRLAAFWWGREWARRRRKKKRHAESVRSLSGHHARVVCQE